MDALATTIEPLALPNKLAAEYLAKWDIAAIAILAPPPGLPCQPSATIDIAEALAGVRKSWPADLEQPALVRAWWTGDSAGPKRSQFGPCLRSPWVPARPRSSRRADIEAE